MKPFMLAALLAILGCGSDSVTTPSQQVIRISTAATPAAASQCFVEWAAAVRPPGRAVNYYAEASNQFHSPVRFTGIVSDSLRHTWYFQGTTTVRLDWEIRADSLVRFEGALMACPTSLGTVTVPLP